MFHQNAGWGGSRSSEGSYQRFHVQLPIIYRVPLFSPNWEDYDHDTTTGATNIYLNSSDQPSFIVYSEAQLQILWQAFYIKGLKDEQQLSYHEINGKLYKLYANTNNICLSTYSKMDAISSDEVPDIANLDGYWTTLKDGSISVRPMCEVYTGNSYDSEGNLKTLDMDVRVIREIATAYGINPEVISNINSMSEVSTILHEQDRISDPNFVLTNTVFLPATIVSPMWYQYPISGYAKGRSPLSVLTNVADRFKVYNISFYVENTSSSTYNALVKMGIFESPTLPIAQAMQNLDNNGAYNIEILEGAKDRYQLYSVKGKTIRCAPSSHEYALDPSVNSWGYNLVVKTTMQWKNFYNNLKGDAYNNCIVPVWTAFISYDVDVVCFIPFLSMASFDARLNDYFFRKYIQDHDSGNTPTVSNVFVTGGVPYANYSNGGNLVSKVASKAAMKNTKKLKRVTRLGEGEIPNSLYQVDEPVMQVLMDNSTYPLNQGISFGGLLNGSCYTLSQYATVSVEGAIEPINPSNKPTISDAEVSTAICPEGGNCYNRRGVCLRNVINHDKIVISEYKVKDNIGAGSKFGVIVGLDEIYAANPVQVNKTNTDYIESTLAEHEKDSIYTTQSLAAETPIGKDFDNPGLKVITEDGDGLSNALAARAVKCVAKNLQKDGLLEFFKGVAQQAVGLGKQVIGKILTGSNQFNNETLDFMSSELNLPADFTAYKKAPVSFEEAYASWTPDFKKFVDDVHPNFKNIPYFLTTDDEDLSIYTPGQVAITKSEVTNMCVGLGVSTDGGAFPAEFRTAQKASDDFSALTSNYCFVILSSIPYGQPGFDRVAVVCNKPGSFLVAPAPCKVSQPSAAGGSVGANIYGQVVTQQCGYHLFNNAMITAVNDLSGTMQFMIPNKIPVLNNDNVEMIDTKSYYDAGNKIYVCIYNMVEMDIEATLGSGVNALTDTKKQYCMALWNYDRPEGSMFPYRTDLVMPQINVDGWSNGRIARLGESNGTLPVLCKYFYMVTDKNNVPQSGSTANTEIPSESATVSKATTPKTPYQIQKIIEKKLPPHMRVQMIHA